MRLRVCIVLALAPLAALACGPSDAGLAGPALDVQGAPLISLGTPEPPAHEAGSAAALEHASPAAPPIEVPLEISPPAAGSVSASLGEPAEPIEPEPLRATASALEPVLVSWDDLSGFDYEMLDLDQVLAIEDGGGAPDLEARFPIEVVELEGRRVELEGFMIPFEYDDRGIVSFTLVRDQAQCCFGASPQMNHWVDVVMREDRRSDSYGLDPIFVRGTFSVGEAVEDGYVTSIYRMVADEVESAW